MKVPTETLQDLMVEAETAKEYRDEADRKFKLLRKRILDELDALETDAITYDDGQDELLEAKRQIQSRVEYDPDVLKQLIPRALFKRVAKIVIDAKAVEALFNTDQLEFNQIQPAAELKEWPAFYIRRIKRQP